MKSGFITGALLLLLLPCVSSDCFGISTEFSSLQFISIQEGAASTGKVFFNVSETSSISFSLSVNPPQYVILQELDEGSNKRWLVRVNGTLDYEKVQTVSGYLKCEQQGQQEFRHIINIIITDVNEFAPNFSQPIYTASVNELVAPATTIFSTEGIASDRDGSNANIFYTLSSTQASFGLNRYGTAVITTQRLDYDFSDRRYNITITARENLPNGKTATALLVINIQDGDDLNPVFDQPFYNTTINEGRYDYQVLFTNPAIHAADRDTGISATLMYEITSVVPDTSFFTILSNGSIMVNGDLQPGATFSINIRVSQVNRTDERYDDAVVLVFVADVNDHPPIMSSSSYVVNVTENSPAGTVITTLNATDADDGFNAMFVFYFSTRTDVFEIDTEGDYGLVRVREGATLDREKKSRYDLQVYAGEIFTTERFNSTASSLVITVLDVNDNSPVFNSSTYTYDIYKNETIGTVVGKVRATDIDEGVNGELRYSLQHSTSSLFGLDLTTGEITVNGTLGNDNVGQVYMVIGAEDQAVDTINRRTSVATVIIIINDVDLYPPVFNETQYDVAVLESLPAQSLVLQLHATDPDDGDVLSFSIISGNDNNTFQIDASSGVVALKRNLDRASRDHFALTAQVSDGQKTSRVLVHVTVLEVHDNKPVFSNVVHTFSMFENSGTSTTVGTVQFTYSIDPREDNSNGLFTIDPVTGVISPANNIDRETMAAGLGDKYTFKVLASDQNNTVSTNVVVTVLDVNDNNPEFTIHALDIYLPENTPSGASVIKVDATDADTVDDGRLAFYLRSPTNAPFSVSKYTGIVSVNGNLDRESVPDYRLEIEVLDSGNRNDTMTLHIFLSEIDEKKPTFENTTYVFKEEGGNS